MTVPKPHSDPGSRPRITIAAAGAVRVNVHVPLAVHIEFIRSLGVLEFLEKTKILIRCIAEFATCTGYRLTSFVPSDASSEVASSLELANRFRLRLAEVPAFPRTFVDMLRLIPSSSLFIENKVRSNNFIRSGMARPAVERPDIRRSRLHNLSASFASPSGDVSSAASEIFLKIELVD